MGSGHSITGGQPWGGVATDYDKLTVKAGRKGSSGPADWFLKNLGPDNIAGCDVASDTSPSKLNFAVSGTLSMNVGGAIVTCPDVRFGQGHSGSRNNWWMGGSNCRGGNKASDPLTCACDNGALVKFAAGSVNHFKAELANKCGVASRRSGDWVAVTAGA